MNSVTEWTNERLNQLADSVERLTDLVQQMGSQIGQLGQRVEQTRSSVDDLVNVVTISMPPTFRAPANLNPPDKQLDRLAALEQQMQQLTQRVKSLEQQLVSVPSPMTVPLELDEEIEDEPDEILWDFIEPDK